MTTDFGGDADVGRSVVVQGDGKIVVVGQSGVGAAADFALARYNVKDTAPPTISSVTTNPKSLWPPNRRMVPVTVAVSVADNGGLPPTCKIAGVSSDEPSEPATWSSRAI